MFFDTTRTPLDVSIAGALVELDAKDVSNNGDGRVYCCKYTGGANAKDMFPNGKASGHVPNVL